MENSQNGKLMILKLEPEAARVQSVDRMSLQYIYQIPIGNYMVTCIYMLFRRLRLKDMSTFNVSEYTEYSLSREKV